MIDLQQLQKEVFENKLAKGFNTTDVSFEFGLTYGELGEAFDAYRKKLPDLGEELADVAIYLLGLASILNINLEEEILKKVEKNKKRAYEKIDGVNIRTQEG
jgi:NTP pyrophosphatase (non-canonical NTP hydrolase)